VYGVAKAYDTYVGNKKFEGDDEIFSQIREAGKEFGSTTGRSRQVDFLDLDFLVRSARINGVTHLIINKVDVLEQVGVWKLKIGGELKTLSNKKEFIQTITSVMTQKTESVNRIMYSESPEDI
jgi:adenylosuccinate synthase